MSQLTPDQAMQLAVAHHQAGRRTQAEALYRQVLARHPNHAGALHLLGVIAYQSGNLQTAVDLIVRSIAIDPQNPDAHSNLASALKDQGKLDEAIAAQTNAIQLQPASPPLHCNLGNVLTHQGKLDAAIAAYRRAIQIDPGYGDAHFNLANVLAEQGSLEEAIVAYRQAIRLQPNHAPACNNLGVALKETERFEEASAAYRQALQLKPDYFQAHNNLANVLLETERFDDAVAAYRRAIQLKPDWPDAHWNLAAALLMHGDFSQGWREYEWRWRYYDSHQRPRSFAQPLWNGQNFNGQTLLIHAEQGYGDMIQFARYVPLASQRGGRVIFACPPELLRLAQSSFGMSGAVAVNQPLPHFDVQCPLLSLPLVFKTTLDSIPASVPYLKPDPHLLETWRQKLPPNAGRLKIGLAWSGRPTHPKKPNRSIAPAQFAPLAAIHGVTFFSLQKGPAAGQMRDAFPDLDLIDLTAELSDFADTAALICHLDLVITIDTAVAHLAGALGNAVWIMLPYMADWRWMIGRQDSPWYPTMRLFRQSARDDWVGVIQRVADSLQTFRGAH